MDGLEEGLSGISIISECWIGRPRDTDNVLDAANAANYASPTTPRKCVAGYIVFVPVSARHFHLPLRI
jgi:hypothetical protein